MQSNLATLTAYNNRYYTSSTGVSSSTWIYNQLVSIAGGKSGITVSQFSHSWAQKSIIAKFNGASTTAAAVIFGCHIDSINLNSPSTGRAPGADDNGTGTVNLIEVFRALVTSGFSPVRPVEFHFYAAEEVGLLGSQAIAANYKSSGKAVYAMINLDMTG
jgi:leucyl aminopeptidase